MQKFPGHQAIATSNVAGAGTYAVCFPFLTCIAVHTHVFSEIPRLWEGNRNNQSIIDCAHFQVPNWPLAIFLTSEKSLNGSHVCGEQAARRLQFHVS